MANLDTGIEWWVDVAGCDPTPPRDPEALRTVFVRVVCDLDLHPGGVTGPLLLRETQLRCHAFPELGTAAFNLDCCRPREPWPWAERRREMLGASRVEGHAVRRGPA